VIHVGLTGGLCSGKSSVAAMFAELGAPVIDADAVVHELLANDETVRRGVVEAFGEAVRAADGSIDRAGLAAAAFGDEAKLGALTSVLYPAVRERLARWFFEQKARGAPAAIAEVSMLFEGGARHLYDVTVVVSADRATRLARFVARGGTPEAFEARVRHQWPLDEKEKQADYVIENNGTREATREAVTRLWAALQKQAAGHTAVGKEEA
jgi:dephospho-CoA kinase